MTSDVEHGLRRDPKRQARKDKGSHKPGWAEKQKERADRPKKPLSEWNKFVIAHSKDPDMEGLTFAQRSKKMGALWKAHKAKQNPNNELESNDDEVNDRPKRKRKQTKRNAKQ